jgi:hypothetical protein
VSEHTYGAILTYDMLEGCELTELPLHSHLNDRRSDLWLLLSPILLHNLSNPSIVRLQSLPSHHTANKSSTITSSSTDSSIDYPIAKSITISRVASEHSMQKKYQPLFISALKNYFKNCQRIAKEGDLIAVPIDASMVMFLSKDAGAENGAGGNDVLDDIQDFE